MIEESENNKKKILFVCRANVSRSVTAETVFSQLAEVSKLELEVKSAGINAADSGTQISKELTDSCDKIYVMEEYMKDFLIHNYKTNPNKIINLNIEDIYQPFDEELVRFFKNYFLDNFFSKKSG